MSTFTPFTYQNGWSDAGSGTEPGGFELSTHDPSFIATISNGTSSSGHALLAFQRPVPLNNFASGVTAVIVSVDPNGNLYMWNGNGEPLNLTGLSFAV